MRFSEPAASVSNGALPSSRRGRGFEEDHAGHSQVGILMVDHTKSTSIQMFARPYRRYRIVITDETPQEELCLFFNVNCIELMVATRNRRRKMNFSKQWITEKRST
jgi:hypothetical protein